MTQSYDVRRSDWFIVELAIASVCATRAVDKTFVTSTVVACVISLLLILTIFIYHKRFLPLLLLIIVIISYLNGTKAMNELLRVELGQYSGLARVISDPQRSGAATQIILDISGDRFIVYAYGPPGWRLNSANAGEQIFVTGQRSKLAPDQAITVKDPREQRPHFAPTRLLNVPNQICEKP